MKLTINLATRRYINMRLLNAFLAGSFLLLGVLLVLRVREIAYNQAELGTVRELSAAAGNRPGAPKVSEAQLKALQAKIAFANAIIEKKSVNWLALLDHLEEVVPPGVALTQIVPGRDQGFTITGVAGTFAGVRALIENMERSKNFSDVFLTNQNETKVGTTQHGITFSLTCKVAYR